MGANDVGAGMPMNGACPNPPELTQWGSTDKSVVGRRPVDAALDKQKEAQSSCPDCDFKTAFPAYMRQHVVDCKRQREEFAEREKSEGVSEEKVAEMIKEATEPVVSALKDLTALLVAKKPRKKKLAGAKKKDEVKPV